MRLDGVRGAAHEAHRAVGQPVAAERDLRLVVSWDDLSA
jgi:hypothetical protein